MAASRAIAASACALYYAHCYHLNRKPADAGSHQSDDGSAYRAMSVYIHLTAALWVLAIGGLQLAATKGTPRHRFVGWSWMAAMIVAAISSFWLTNPGNGFLGYGPIHLLSIWVMICVVVSVGAVRRGNIRRHRGFAVGAYLGTVGAAIGALAMPGRLLHSYFFA
ncbi:MAG: DUF2306 domain-containing protein [Halieaceae bacterium]|jgi:uncharacterized membrane protein|uniref:DUF2306 domain-containing protein n=1 Tax=Haliea alexandrii TaxID=2448162 RepID=UPI0018EE9FEB|nr:DUF2306 domain-containing protein [Haliea alexandrii]MCR9186021.1 DUF2306 domain-containing protein [Halieaceae bacterium]